jgi:hypothetical protein
MRAREQKAITMVCLTALAGAVAWGLCSSPAPTVSLQVFGYETNTIDEPGIFTNHQYFCALVRITNSGKRAVTYYGNGIGSPFYECSAQTEQGWVSQTPIRCGLGSGYQKLRPAQAAAFTVLLHEPERRLQVSIEYSQPGATDRIWRLLPQWLTQWIPKGKGTASVVIHKLDPRP